VEKSSPKCVGHFCNFQKQPEVNSHPTGENSPNLVTLSFGFLIGHDLCLNNSELVRELHSMNARELHFMNDKEKLIF
jgi:hypothetical protein